MKKPRLSMRDFELINLALDILESDYSDGGKKGAVIVRAIYTLKAKLARMQ